MEYVGEYKLKIENGKVAFPWDSPVKKSRVWVASESMVDDAYVTNYAIINADVLEEYISENKQYSDKYKVLSTGDFLLDKNNLWKVPEIIMKHLKTDEIIFCGLETFVEIMSVEDMENYEKLLSDFEETLKKAAIEEGLYDEHTK